MSLQLIAQTPADLPQIAAVLLANLGDRKVITFSGNMGAGKTTFIKVFCAQLDVVDEVQSPTYSLANEYHTAHHQTVYHLDLYRLNDITEAIHIGIEDYLYADAYCLIEWATVIAPLLPENTIQVNIVVDEKQQRIFNIIA